ncbi:MAG: hypothetical protein ACLGIG_13010 [Actinomycetes bacterium]
MKRRVLAIAAAAATAVAVLPATAAFASAASTAALTAGSAVYPGADRSFTIKVTNNEALLVGKTIDAIRINFPVSEAGVTLGSGTGTAAGCTDAKATNLSTTQFLTYRGCSLRAGQSLDITFPANVAAPSARDLLGDFRVQVSSDNFKSASTAAGNLMTKVQVLEILQSGLKPLAPTNGDGSKGVTDRSGTSGQAITYGTEVKNYAKTDLSVVTNLTSAAGDTASPTTITVPAGGTAVAQVPVQLGTAASDRSTVFTASAEKADKSAVAPTKNDTFTVQAPAALSITDLQPTRVKSGPGSARDFSAKVAKSGTPAVDSLSSTLTFGTNSATTSDGSFGRGSSSGSLTWSFQEIAGSDGAFPATASTTITDDNLATYSDPVDKLADVVIDNLAPIVDLAVALPKDRDGDQQVAVKNGDTITVSGTLTNAGDYAANSLKVVLRPNVGQPVEVPVTVSGNDGDETRTFSGSAKPTWDPAATSFIAESEVRDTAGNIGTDGVPATTIDNAIPTMIGSGVIVEADKIEVDFDDATGVAGGCDPRMWLLDGTPGQVTAVADANGGDCRTRDSGARTLTLRNPLAVDQTPRVTYDPTGSRVVTTFPAKDGAGNDALRQTIETVTNLIPKAPGLVSVERRDGSLTGGFEAAYQDADNGSYYTNVAGEDAMRLTVSGIRQNYTLEVLEGTTVVARKKFTAAPPLGASSYNGDIAFPVSAGDGQKSYTTRFVSSVGNIGDPTGYSVVLDTVAPALGNSSINGSTVTLAFTDKIVTGSDFADNWFVSETVDTETGTAVRTVNVDSVSGGTQTGRTFEVTLRDPSRFTGMDYYVQSGSRYEDRAGNLLADTLG